MPNNPTQSLITLRDIEFSWAKDKPATLKFSQLDIKAGERIFIKGPSGSGKSTLLGLLTGIITPQLGQVNLLGNDLAQMKQSQRDSFRADHIGYIFQQFNLIPYLSVIENIVLPCHFSAARKLRVSSELKQQAHKLLEHLKLPPALYHSPVTELSIGQQQRVAAARALIGQPEILIADEPTSALDHDNREAFITLLMEEAKLAGSTLIFVSHDPTLEHLFDRCIDLTQLNLAMGVAS
ncbi:ABC transporter ATP-binding protein [Vibrio sp. SCSIO 43136]|uniref:ABC transporter ATP-binding protein n=1 Tax=Vibrio sp. SCSIO 43136 TaxID=2819101 RepID=UPI0020764EF3|nr:ABC transporter ATP-binding protein [Vibrio sp. SCSIO 43136]USD65576.1 ABC transporter ATP-binding protein [Vibrio sp. SCSIO 43136]